jgi:sugar phosphate isomerase/epimerase
MVGGDQMNGIDRRRFFTTAAAGAAGLITTAQGRGKAAPWPRISPERENGMARIPIALQVYSVRHDAAKDLAGVLAKVAEMGYEGVEFAGLYDHSPADVRKMLDDNGLKCTGTHIGLDTLLGDQFDKSIEMHQALGNKFPIVPGLAEQYRNSADAWRKTADLFNELADKLEPHGMRTGYHNHSIEFQPMDGQVPWDVFFGNTKDAVVMQLDTGNAMSGGGDPVAILEKYPGRAGTIHLKPYSPSLAKDNPHAGFRPAIGEDETPWERVLGLCEEQGGTEWYIVEYESDKYPPMEAVEKCLQALKAMGR